MCEVLLVSPFPTVLGKLPCSETAPEHLVKMESLFGRSGWSMKFCVSNKLPDVTDAFGSWTTL